MKKSRIISALALMLSAFLCSCSMIPGYIEPEEQYILSALGFDLIEDGIVEVSASLAVGERGEMCAYGRGESIEEAISSLTAGLKLGLESSHCGVIVLGAGIEGEWLRSILGYCQRNEELAISAALVSASSARELLSLEDVSGFELAGSVSKSRENAAFGAENRFYQVEGARGSEENLFALPHFEVNGEGYELYGVRIYKNDRATVLLSRVESAYYMMIRGLFTRGIFAVDSPGLSGSVGVSDCKTSYDFSTEGEILIKCRISLDAELADESYADEISRAAEEGMERIYTELSARYGDLFGLRGAAKIKGAELSGDERVVFSCEVLPR